MGNVGFALLLSAFAGLSTAIGGLIASIRSATGERFLSLSMGLSAGVMIYVSFVELLPEGVDGLSRSLGEGRGELYATLAFFVGVLLIALIDRLVPESVNPHEPKMVHNSRRRAALMHAGILTALAIGIHNFPEGFATFAAAFEDPSVGVAVAVAIAIHNIPEGIAVAVPIREATGSRAKGFKWALISGITEPIGAVLGYLILMPFIGPGMLGVVFAAIAGVMVFISLDELLPTAIQIGHHHLAIYGLIAGMAVMAVSLLALA